MTDDMQALRTTRLAKPRFGLDAWTSLAVVTLGPILAAFLLCALALLIAGHDPLAYYLYVAERGVFSAQGLQQTLTRMAPLLLHAASLIIAFRAGIWNLGGDGQFLLGAVMAAALAPALITVMPDWVTLIACMVLAMLVGALWALVPALLRAYQGVNEIITTLMMTFLGTSLANVLVKLAFLDPATTVPQTRTLPVEDRLPWISGTTITSGLLIGLAAVIAVHVVMTRTAFGLRLRVVGANPKAALHAGLPVPLLTVAVFCLSGALAGLGGAVDIVGVFGNVRADWNPAYALAVVPLVFLARFNGYAAIAFVFFYAVLEIGGESAARRIGVPQHFTLILVATMFILLALAEWLDQRRRAREKS
ncbi:ABC transporter permease [Nordella sp. HKS 07]|uniref:putative B6 ABC transporter permease subunit 2 n=1 Tax=Nordella sp. HKS 07 TaxID=2712222 RepID=UPI0013E1CA7F|nr:ABC transporter permease [Nordella sp. HKS 07]QIG50243.1 ABC transporter permease [Nordella sp. HKS 07]